MPQLWPVPQRQPQPHVRRLRREEQRAQAAASGSEAQAACEGEREEEMRDEWTPWPSIRALTVLVVVLLFFAVFVYLTTGCGRVRAYQQHATERCEEHHTAEQCRALSTPACSPSNSGGQNGCHN